MTTPYLNYTYLAYAVIAFVLFLIQCFRFRIYIDSWYTYYLLFASFTICYQNVYLYGYKIGRMNENAYEISYYVISSLTIPLLFILFSEPCAVMYRKRFIYKMLVEQGEEVEGRGRMAAACKYLLTRLIGFGLFAMSFIAYFLLNANNNSGYLSLNHPTEEKLLILIPSLVLSFTVFIASLSVFNYFDDISFQLKLYICKICFLGFIGYFLCHLFNSSDYQVIAHAGDLFLLMTATFYLDGILGEIVALEQNTKRNDSSNFRDGRVVANPSSSNRLYSHEM